MLTGTTYERYQRQVLLKGFGEGGQEKLLRARVLVVGAGGLGCPVLQYLAAAGVGIIGIIDDDVVQASNLHRQVLYGEEHVGEQKAIVAASILSRANPSINIIPIPERLCSKNAFDIVAAYDVVVDGSDNFATRYLVNDICVLLDKPLVYGAVSSFEGQVAVFNLQKDREPKVNYRDLFPQPPSNGEIPNCAEAGVLGVLPGIIGAMQANEVIKIITGLGEPLVSKMLTFNSLSNQCYEMNVSASPSTGSLIPKDRDAFEAMDYEWLCNTTDAAEIDPSSFATLVNAGGVDIVDIREEYELPEINGFPHMKIPLHSLPDRADSLKSETIILICQSGKRSLYAARTLKNLLGPAKKIYSIAGGITALQQLKKPVTND